MDDNGYKAFFGMILNSARVLDIVPMQKMLETVNRADSFGAILDPTAYRNGMKNLAPQREVLEAAMKFHAVVMKNTPQESPDGSH